MRVAARALLLAQAGSFAERAFTILPTRHDVAILSSLFLPSAAALAFSPGAASDAAAVRMIRLVTARVLAPPRLFLLLEPCLPLDIEHCRAAATYSASRERAGMVTK